MCKTSLIGGSGAHFYRDEMMHFLESISHYGKSKSPGFLVFPQNGELLLDAYPNRFLTAIDGVGRESLNYGYSGVGTKTPALENKNMLDRLVQLRSANKEILVTDYCNEWDCPSAIRINTSHRFQSFVATTNALDAIPNDTLAADVLYLLNFWRFETPEAVVKAISESTYPLVIMDAFFDTTVFTQDLLAQLKRLPNGNRRRVLAYMSIGEAETYRWYWKSYWKFWSPQWLGPENEDWEGNYLVRYWDKRWQRIIYGTPESYLDKIMDAGFDGVYLDIVDAYQRWE
ncbi:MAG: endo alpha-1,4 polygalactosaminidase [bacterium]|nr:endo alpha-1,4 polygalactosaminidase [bacterium]